MNRLDLVVAFIAVLLLGTIIFIAEKADNEVSQDMKDFFQAYEFAQIEHERRMVYRIGKMFEQNQMETDRAMGWSERIEGDGWHWAQANRVKSSSRE